MLAVTVVGSQAGAATIKGKDISTVPDILKEASGISGKNSVNLQFEKFSILRLHDDGQLDLHYNIGSGDNDLSLGKIENYSSVPFGRDNGLLAAISKTNFGGNRVFIGSTKIFGQPDATGSWLRSSNWAYDIYFATVSKDDDGKIAQSRFGTWRYPIKTYNTQQEALGANAAKSGYLKDIKTGIFVDGFDGELVVTATMEAANDCSTLYSTNYNNKKTNAALNFWALYNDASGDVQYMKVDSLDKTVSGYVTATLNGIICALDKDFDRLNYWSQTLASPYMSIKLAVGDFNNDGYDNEVAMLAVDVETVYLSLYQVNYDAANKKFSLRVLQDSTIIHTYDNPAYEKRWGYNGGSRMHGGEILAGDFDGDGKTEIATVCYGDAVSSARDTDWTSWWDGSLPKEGQMYYGANIVHLPTHLYKWNSSRGRLDATNSSSGRWGMLYTHQWLTYKKTTTLWNGHRQTSTVTAGYEKSLTMLYGGLKAVTLDIDGDGTDEIAIAGTRSIKIECVDSRPSPKATRFYYEVKPFATIVRRNKSSGELKPDSNLAWEGGNLISKYFTTKAPRTPAYLYDVVVNDHASRNAFLLEGGHLAHVNLGEREILQARG